MTPDKQRSATDGCVVCYREVKSKRRRMNLDIPQYDGEYTVRVRLEQILEDGGIPEDSPSWMCDVCFKELTQIEEYYQLLRRFKSKYQQTRFLIENAEKMPSIVKPKRNMLLNCVSSDGEEEDGGGETEDSKMFQLHLPYLSEMSGSQGGGEVEVKKELDEGEGELGDEDQHDSSFSTNEFTDQSTDQSALLESPPPAPAMGYEGALKKPIKCVICGESGDAQYMRKHMIDYHCNELHPLACKTCGKSFRSKKKLLRHSALHNGRRPYKCLLCPKDFGSTEHLRRHVKVHSKSLPLHCCDKELVSEDELQAHMLEHRQHREKITYNCTDCENVYTSKREYVNHLKSEHEDRYEEKKTELEVICIMCNKTFANQSKLTRHMQAHSDAAPYACNLCEKRFKREQTLQEHQRVHSGEKPYQCSMCDKSYLARASLQSHERTHTGEKQCLCPVCGKGFHENSYLTRHMTTHSEEKKHKCPVCGKGFKRADHVTKHMPIHTGIKPYLCNICGTSFARLDKLKQHMHKHTRPDKPKPPRKPKIPRPPKVKVDGEKPKKPRVRKPKKPKMNPTDGPKTVGGKIEALSEPLALNQSHTSMDGVGSQPAPTPTMDHHPHHNMEGHSSLAGALTSAQFLTASHIGLMAIGAQYGTYPYSMEDDGDNKYMNVPPLDMHHDAHYTKHMGHH